MKKSNKLVWIIVAVLFALSLLFVFLSKDSIAEKMAAQEKQSFTITVGDQSYEVTMQQLTELGLEEIDANYKPNGKAPTTRRYAGVPFLGVADSLDLELSQYQKVSFLALDGYATALSLEEAMDEAFIAVELAGEPLGSKADGGTGPFMMVLPNDQFSQRWCKFLYEIKVD